VKDATNKNAWNVCGLLRVVEWLTVNLTVELGSMHAKRRSIHYSVGMSV
jgi:hypothetical protein